MRKYAPTVIALCTAAGLVWGFFNFNGRLTHLEQEIGVHSILKQGLGDQACEWQPIVETLRVGLQDCPPGFYVKGIEFRAHSASRRPYPRYRLNCCALTTP